MKTNKNSFLTQGESESLNTLIDNLDGIEGFEHDKPIPYIGWFWRRVDFTKPYDIGYVPKGTPEYTVYDSRTDIIEEGPKRDMVYVGFMENNKWDYPYVTLKEEDYEFLNKEFRRLLEVNEGERESVCRSINDYIQTLA